MCMVALSHCKFTVLWHRKLVEIHWPITPCKCKGWRDEQGRTACGEGGRASYSLGFQTEEVKLCLGKSQTTNSKQSVQFLSFSTATSPWQKWDAEPDRPQSDMKHPGLYLEAGTCLGRGSLCCSDTSWKSHTSVTGLAERYWRHLCTIQCRWDGPTYMHVGKQRVLKD